MMAIKVNVIRFIMDFYGSYKYKSPHKRRRDRLGKMEFLGQSPEDPVLVPI